MTKKIDFSTRPIFPNPECNAKHTWDNGARWICGVCGKQWAKTKFPRKIKENKERPQCPTCGAFRSSPHKGDFGWQCLRCGATFTILLEEF